MEQNELFTSEKKRKRKPLTEEQKKKKREYERKRYASRTEEQKKKKLEGQRKWYASLTEEQKKKNRERRRKWVASLDLDQCRNKKIVSMYFQAKNRAENKGLPFNITRQDIADVWPKDDYCPALRIPLKIRRGNKISTDNSPNLDRVIPILGYVKGNIAVVSKLANSIMSSARPSEVIKVGKWFDEKYYEVKDKLNV